MGCTRTDFLRSLCAGTLGAAAGPALAQSSPDAPNIILFLMDDQAWAGTSLVMDRYRPESNSDFFRTPNLESLGRQGMTFSFAYAAAPMCGPSRASIQYGQSPAKLLHTGNTDAGRCRGGTGLAQALKAARPEYRAAHFGKWHVFEEPGALGYDEHDGRTGNESQTGPEDDPKRVREITNKAVDFMNRQVEAGHPFFLQVSQYAVHTPIRARKDLAEKWEARPGGTCHDGATYAALTEEADLSLGAILTRVRELGIEDSTYIIYTSDNGGSVLQPDHEGVPEEINRPLSGGKLYLSEGGLRVPLVIKGPGIVPRGYTYMPAVGHDLYPTVLDMAGVSSVPPEVEGGSLLPVCTTPGEVPVNRPREGLVWHFPNPHVNYKKWRAESSVLWEDWKLIKIWDTGERRLFNLVTDPYEEYNLAAQFPSRADELEQKLSAYLKSVDAAPPAPDPSLRRRAIEFWNEAMLKRHGG
ncbi:sulfatase-like hydrolase/transferase [Kiritimatiella glycovorans]|uniref:Choline-sulfatase n=1 Tax=Kiritimatiella glycovorans TaxID=1307763 RepID=A0A0G3EEC2_9BACT|nr:sulfatase-like hydrolase/transferase [Kiritimatiella glycovorans]AKJ64673.1 Choline-sulfatase [Kiritimatiella glycovorans]